MTRAIDRWGVCLVIVGTLGASAAHAQTPPVNPQFGMVGLAAGQTIRLNIVAFPPNPCNAAIGFLNKNGNTPQPDPSKTVSLAPGQSDFVDLTAGALGIQPGGRREFQPVAILSDATSACGVTVEVFNSATGADLVAAPQPEPNAPGVAPQFGMIGITAGETLRLNVVAYPPNPCVADIGFLNGAGLPAVQDTVVTLGPNQAGLLDLHAVTLGLQAGDRAELQPVVTLLASPTGTSTCQVDAEVFNPATGRTRVMLNPQPLPPRKTPQ